MLRLRRLPPIRSLDSGDDRRICVNVQMPLQPTSRAISPSWIEEVGYAARG
jgi:hypothetical protein